MTVLKRKLPAETYVRDTYWRRVGLLLMRNRLYWQRVEVKPSRHHAVKVVSNLRSGRANLPSRTEDFEWNVLGDGVIYGRYIGPPKKEVQNG